MKILIISDVHGNVQSLEAIRKQEQSWDMLLCAGDVADYGTHPKESIQWLRENGARVVKGNHDNLVVQTYRAGGFSSVPGELFKWAHYACQQLDEEAVLYLDALPGWLDLELDGIRYSIKHQYVDGYENIESLYQYDNFWRQHSAYDLEGEKAKRMIFGHSHRQCIHIFSNNKLWLNPGSTSYRRPDDPDKSTHYAVIEDTRIHLRRASYDRTPSLLITKELHRRRAMMLTELQDAFFFFGDAPTTRSPLPPVCD
jgi:predicted phosphodiesterase